MACDDWIEFNGVELVNLSRTAQLAEVLGIDTVWTDPASVQWVQDALGGGDYDLITDTPWYDSNYPASREFAGLVPLSFAGLDDSTLESSTVEYITAGGSSSGGRHRTKPIVASLAIVASTERGADFGKRWMNRVLAGTKGRGMCSGSEMHFFQWAQRDGEPVPPRAHFRDVTMTRGVSITRKRSSHCSATWLVTFTLTANDPFQYGQEQPQFIGLGGVVTGAGAVIDSGSNAMIEQACPVYDYSPIYDPLHPALVEPPSMPFFYPDGWNLLPGVSFTRHWVRIQSPEPSALSTVPVVTLTANSEARMVRVSIWDADAPENAICDPLWTAVISYLPPGVDFVLDGEQSAAYVWDGVSPQVRRSDSLVYGTDARPMNWTSVSDPDSLRVTLDVQSGAGYDGGGSVRAALSLVPKSD